MTLSGSNLATFTEQTKLNGNTWTQLFNASTSTWTTTSPAGRVSTTTVDAAERPTQICGRERRAVHVRVRLARPPVDDDPGLARLDAGLR